MLKKVRKVNNIDTNLPTDPVYEDSQKEVEKSEPEIIGEQSVSGMMTNPEEVEEKDTLEMAQDVGLYTENDEEHPAEVGIAQEIEEAEKKRWEE